MRPVTRRLSLVFLALAVLGANPPVGSPCGDPIASGVQHGTFTKIALGSQCDVQDSSGPTVSLSVGGTAPIFWIGQLIDGECRMTLGTIENENFATIAHTVQDVGGQAPVDIGHGEYWSNANSHTAYVKLDVANHTDALVDLVTPDGRARVIASDGSGKAYSIEVPMNGAGTARLVDMETRTSQALPPATFTRRLRRGADGRLYFEQYYLKTPKREPCELFVVEPSGHVAEATNCGLTGDMTVGASGSVWDATELGVVLRDPSTGTQTLYAPVFAPPCNNFSPSSSYTHNIVADVRGNAWFVLGRLWHVDRRGKVTSIDIPERSQQDVATRGLFETADGTLWLFSKKFVEHFVP